MAENINRFFEKLAESLESDSFVKLTLSNYKGADEHLQKVYVRPIETKKGRLLQFNYRYATRDTAKNFNGDEALKLLHSLVGSDFENANLFTTSADFQLSAVRGKELLTRAKPSFASLPVLSHDREKKTELDPTSHYWRELGITGKDGQVLKKQRDKWAQINKFVEIFSTLVSNRFTGDKIPLNVVDMGSGKGYLTFAVYDHLTVRRHMTAVVTGVEARRDLVEICDRTARSAGFEGLSFVPGSIQSHDPTGVDILIALHACDTATDEALYKGIVAGAKIIIASPCCHKELRRQIRAPDHLRGLMRHGTFVENLAEMVTDSLRALLLERAGFSTKVFEFVGSEHTPKNNLITAVRGPGRDKALIEKEIQALKSLFRIESQRLEYLLT